MATGRDDSRDDNAVETRIAEMKDRLAAMAGGKLAAWDPMLDGPRTRALLA